MKVIGIDPGANTGVATFESGNLLALETIAPHQIERVMRERMPTRVVFEDSRLQGHTWTQVPSRPAALKMARNVGQIDAWCILITALCADLGIAAHGVSPQGKGIKIGAAQFNALTGWAGRSNQHERDGAMCVWPYRKVVSVA